jgi:hypothetical protein
MDYQNYVVSLEVDGGTGEIDTHIVRMTAEQRMLLNEKLLEMRGNDDIYDFDIEDPKIESYEDFCWSLPLLTED